MDDRRVTPVTGILSVVLFVIALFVIESGDTPAEDATGADVAAYFDGALGTLAVALILWGLGTIAARLVPGRTAVHVSAVLRPARTARFLLRLRRGALHARLPAARPVRCVRERSARAAARVRGGGSDRQPRRRVLLRRRDDARRLLPRDGTGSDSISALPVWVGWFALLLAIVALIPPIGWAVVVFGFPIFILLVSVLMWLRAEPAVVEPASVADRAGPPYTAVVARPTGTQIDRGQPPRAVRLRVARPARGRDRSDRYRGQVAARGPRDAGPGVRRRARHGGLAHRRRDLDVRAGQHREPPTPRAIASCCCVAPRSRLWSAR